jgi:hypothetical protein
MFHKSNHRPIVLKKIPPPQQGRHPGLRGAYLSLIGGTPAELHRLLSVGPANRLPAPPPKEKPPPRAQTDPNPRPLNPSPCPSAILVLVFAVSNAHLAALLREALARGAPFRFEATGWSMAPFIRHGDAVTVSPLTSPPRPGDVVAFALPGARPLLLHRVVATRPGGLLLRGDNSSAPDGLIPPADIYGHVTAVERRGAPRRLGLGPERRLLAALSRAGILRPLLRAAASARTLLPRR